MLLQGEITVESIGFCHVIVLHTTTTVKELVCNLKGSSLYEYLLGTKLLALNILCLLENLIAYQLVKSVPSLYGTQISLLLLLQLTICLFPEPEEFSPRQPILFYKDQI